MLRWNELNHLTSALITKVVLNNIFNTNINRSNHPRRYCSLLELPTWAMWVFSIQIYLICSSEVKGNRPSKDSRSPEKGEMGFPTSFGKGLKLARSRKCVNGYWTAFSLWFNGVQIPMTMMAGKYTWSTGVFVSTTGRNHTKMAHSLFKVKFDPHLLHSLLAQQNEMFFFPLYILNILNWYRYI